MSPRQAISAFLDVVRSYYADARPQEAALSPGQVVEWLRAAWERNLVICAPRNLGIRHLVSEFADTVEDQPAGITAFVVRGFASDECRPEDCRLWLTLWFPEDGEISLMLKMDASQNAEDVDFGNNEQPFNVKLQMGVVLIILALATVPLYAMGYTALNNEPENDKLRGLYAKLGFLNGDRFELRNPECVSRFLAHAGRSLRFLSDRAGDLRYQWP